jgi:RNA polymerase sigma factor for flagellar operon FliA
MVPSSRPDVEAGFSLPHAATKRERAVLRNLAFVRRVASMLRRRLPSHLEFDDLVSAGTIGMIEALDRYDAERGVAFSTFAYARIRGAMLDEARRLRTDPLGAGKGRGTAGEDAAEALTPGPGRHAELAELLREVLELPPRERKAVALRAQGYSLAEIASLHGCSETRASQLLAQARLRLEERTAA